MNKRAALLMQSSKENIAPATTPLVSNMPDALVRYRKMDPDRQERLGWLLYCLVNPACRILNYSQFQRLIFEKMQFFNLSFFAPPDLCSQQKFSYIVGGKSNEVHTVPACSVFAIMKKSDRTRQTLEFHVFGSNKNDEKPDIPKFRGTQRMPLSHGLLQTDAVWADLQAEVTHLNM